MTDIAPVAKAVGTALGGVLGAIDKEFRSGTWQQFFKFMAAPPGRTSGCSARTSPTCSPTLPPLLEALQPLAEELLSVTDNALKAVGAVGSSTLILPSPPADTGASGSSPRPCRT